MLSIGRCFLHAAFDHRRNARQVRPRFARVSCGRSREKMRARILRQLPLHCKAIDRHRAMRLKRPPHPTKRLGVSKPTFPPRSKTKKWLKKRCSIRHRSHRFPPISLAWRRGRISVPTSLKPASGSSRANVTVPVHLRRLTERRETAVQIATTLGNSPRRFETTWSPEH